jgi:hypothetical protein
MDTNDAIRAELDAALGLGFQVTHANSPQHGTKILKVVSGDFEYCVLCGGLKEDSIRQMYVDDILYAYRIRGQ